MTNQIQVYELEENEQRKKTLRRVGNQHLRHLRSIHDQYRDQVEAAENQHDEQVKAIEENGRLSPTKFKLVQEEIRRRELLNHNKTVRELEKKNTDQEAMHARRIKVLDRVVKCQDNQLKNQLFEMGEQEKELNELRQIEVKEAELEQGRKHTHELKEMKEMMNVEYKHKLEEDNKVLKSQVERLKVDSNETC